MGNETAAAEKPFWLPDTQGFLAIAIILVVSVLAFVLLMRPVTFDDKVAGAFMTLLGVLTACLNNVYNYFFGSSRGSAAKDDALTKLVATPAPPPASPDAVIAWWSLLTEQERAEITKAAITNDRVRAFVESSAAGKATPADLDYLVSVGLLTPERSRAVQSA